MFLMMAIALYTSRVVLDVLGAADYGLNNVINGVVILFSFLNNALLSATQRFLNYSIGQNDLKKTNSVFCMSMNTYFILSIFVFLLGETIGLWFVNTQLNISENRMYAAHWVYQFTLLQFSVNLLRIPYNASIIAYERMSFYAYVSLFEGVAKLLLVYILYITSFDKLIIYSFLYTLVPILITIVYKIYCNKVFTTTRYRFIWDVQIFKSLFSFSGWSLLGSLAHLSAQQGINILINIFYGVTVNAALGIANQISANVYGFISNFQTAFQPQIIKSYAANDHQRLNSLIFKTSKFSYYMVIVLVIPILFTMDGLLDLWLKEIPQYTSDFARLILVFMCIEAITAPLWMSVQATGKIRDYQILMAGIVFLNFPLAFCALKMGFSPYSVFYIRIIINIISLFVRCIYMKYKMDFPFARYFVQVLIPIIRVSFFAIPIPLLAYHLLNHNIENLLFIGLLSFVIVLLDIYYGGLNGVERISLNKLIKNKLFHR